jgi:hypothetical protein
MNVAAGIPATAGIIFRNFLSGKRRINNKAKAIETAKHDPWFSRAYVRTSTLNEQFVRAI